MGDLGMVDWIGHEFMKEDIQYSVVTDLMFMVRGGFLEGYGVDAIHVQNRLQSTVYSVT